MFLFFILLCIYLCISMLLGLVPLVSFAKPPFVFQINVSECLGKISLPGIHDINQDWPVIKIKIWIV